MMQESSNLITQLNDTATIVIILGILISIWITFELVLSLTINRYEHRTDPFSKKVMLLYFKWCAFWTRGQVVTLLTSCGKVYLSVALKIPNSENLMSYTYYRSKIGHIMLHPNGTVSTLGYSPMDGWLPIDVEKRTWMILQGAKGFDY